MLPNRGKDVARAICATAHLGDEQWIAAPGVLLAPGLEIAEVDIRRDQIELRRADAPDVERVRQWAATGPITRLLAAASEAVAFLTRVVQPCVDIQRQIVGRF